MIVDARTVGEFRENSYLVADAESGRAALIDPGAEPEALVEMVTSRNLELEAIWLTHAHIDHIGGIAGVRRRYNVPVHLHPADLPLYLRGAEQAAAYGLAFEQPEPPELELADGGVLTLGPLTFQVIHLPGHSPGHVAFLLGDTLFGGDVLFAGSIGRTDLPLSDPVRMQKSLERICQLDDETVVYPGHGPSTTIGKERATNGFLEGVARLVRPRSRSLR